MTLPGGGMDLAVEWRSRRWRRLLNIIDQLPRNSRFVEAMASDVQLAEQLATRPESEHAAPRRRMSEWSVEVELLSQVLNRLGELGQALAALGGAKPHKVAPAPTPVTAIDKVRNRKRFAKHKSLVDRVLPHRRPPT